MGERLWALGSRLLGLGFGLSAKLSALERNIGLSLAKDDKTKGPHRKYKKSYEAGTAGWKSPEPKA